MSARVTRTDGWRTFGDITRKVTRKYAADTQLQLTDDTAILAELRPMIVNTVPVKAHEVTMNARFIEDLGFG